MTLAEIDNTLAGTMGYIDKLERALQKYERDSIEWLHIHHALSGVKIARLKLLTRRRALERCYEHTKICSD